VTRSVEVKLRARRRLRAVVALVLGLAGAHPVAAIASSPAPSNAHRVCDQATRQPQTVIRAWLTTYAIDSSIPCRLNAAKYHPSEPPFGRYRLALAEPLRSESRPGHRLYLVLLFNQTRVAQYLLDLHPNAQARWLVDLWAEL
jgi:hypothetical protein